MSSSVGNSVAEREPSATVLNTAIFSIWSIIAGVASLSPSAMYFKSIWRAAHLPTLFIICKSAPHILAHKVPEYRIECDEYSSHFSSPVFS